MLPVAGHLLIKRDIMAKSSQSRRIVSWPILLALLFAIIFGLPILWFLGFDPTSSAQVHDAVSTSPDGAYIAATRDIDTGAVGNSSCILIKSANSQFPKFGGGEGEIAYGPYGGFDPVEWVGPRILQITYGNNKAQAGWKTRWRDVEIIYK